MSPLKLFTWNKAPLRVSYSIGCMFMPTFIFIFLPLCLKDQIDYT